MGGKSGKLSQKPDVGSNLSKESPQKPKDKESDELFPQRFSPENNAIRNRIETVGKSAFSAELRDFSHRLQLPELPPGSAASPKQQDLFREKETDAIKKARQYIEKKSRAAYKRELKSFSQNLQIPPFRGPATISQSKTASDTNSANKTNQNKPRNVSDGALPETNKIGEDAALKRPTTPPGVNMDNTNTFQYSDFTSLWKAILNTKVGQPSVNQNRGSFGGGLDWTGHIIQDDDYHIGGGSFGDVYKGKWVNCSNIQEPLPEVAVKIIRTPRLDDKRAATRLKQLRREVAVWQLLQHENILPFVGISHTRGTSPSLVSLWMENGCVKEYVKQPGVSRLKILFGIARGLNYLHSHMPEIVHGDMKGDNVLVDKTGVPKLCDFGVSRMVESLDQTLWATSATSASGTTRFKAPELLNGGQKTVTTAGDIYAYAMTSLELMTDKAPFHEHRNDVHVMLAVVLKHERPKRPKNESISQDLWNLWVSCWTEDPGQRPPMNQVMTLVSAMTA